jgi:hypothetical protein
MWSNDQRSHAGPVMSSTPRDEIPALAAAFGSAISLGEAMTVPRLGGKPVH